MVILEGNSIILQQKYTINYTYSYVSDFIPNTASLVLLCILKLFVQRALIFIYLDSEN